MEKTVTKKTKRNGKPGTNALYQEIRTRAKAPEGETVRFLSDLVRTPSFSTKEQDIVPVIKNEMQKSGFDEVRTDGLGNVIGRVGKGTVTISEVKSSAPSQCSVADEASVYLDRRLTLGETKESTVAELRDAATRAACPDARVYVLKYEEAAYTGKVYPTEKYYPTWALDENSPYLMDAVAAYSGVLGRQPLVDKWTFSTNGVAISGMNGIPCLGFGPGNENQAHAVNESCLVEHLSGAVAFYAALVARLNGKV